MPGKLTEIEKQFKSEGISVDPTDCVLYSKLSPNWEHFMISPRTRNTNELFWQGRISNAQVWMQQLTLEAVIVPTKFEHQLTKDTKELQLTFAI